MLPIRTILHPTDFSQPSQAAFRLACALARDYGARLILLHVAELPIAFYGEGALVPPPAIDWETLRAELEQLKPRDPRIQVEHELAQGPPAAEILRWAQET